jgi:hypothetical protein
MAAAWVIEVVSRKRRAPILQHPLQTARGDMGPRQVLWYVRQAEPSKHCIQHRDRPIEHELSIDVDVQRAAIAFELLGVQTAVGWQTQVDAAVLGMKYELIQMREQGSGAIVNTSSLGGLVGIAGRAAYHASKHAVLGLTKSAALEYAARGIRINAVCPEIIDTPMVAAMKQSEGPAMAELMKEVPIVRLGRPEEIASAVLWLCSPGAAYVIGHALVVGDGAVGLCAVLAAKQLGAECIVAMSRHEQRWTAPGYAGRSNASGTSA